MDLSPGSIRHSGDQQMKGKRRNHSTQFKVNVALAEVKGDQTVVDMVALKLGTACPAVRCNGPEPNLPGGQSLSRACGCWRNMLPPSAKSTEVPGTKMPCCSSWLKRNGLFVTKRNSYAPLGLNAIQGVPLRNLVG